MKHNDAPYRTSGCADWKKPCPRHSVHHYKCDECGVDCTIGTPDGPPTTETDGITRCYKCNHKVQRFWAVGKNAIVAKAAPDLLVALNRAIAFIADVVEGRDWEGCAGREIVLTAEAAVAKAEGR